MCACTDICHLPASTEIRTHVRLIYPNVDEIIHHITLHRMCSHRFTSRLHEKEEEEGAETEAIITIMRLVMVLVRIVVVAKRARTTT